MSKIRRIRTNIDPNKENKENNILSWNLETGQIEIRRWSANEYPSQQILKQAK